MEKKNTYNERLFSGGLRARLHLARFHWLNQRLKQYLPDSNVNVMELGCFDARSMHHFPSPPTRYLGINANWEGGLDLARQRFSRHPDYSFLAANHPQQVEIAEASFNVILSLETLEHVPPPDVSGWLRLFKNGLKRDGLLLVTIPNEKGPLFAIKHLAKLAVYGKSERYTLREFMCATLGRSDQIKRHEHKGFDWELLQREISEYFNVIECQGVQFPSLPSWMSPQIGLVARPRY